MTGELEHTPPVNLHDIADLKEVVVRDGIILRPLQAGDADQILGILDEDPGIRDRVSVASKMHSHADVAAQVEAYQADDHLIRYVVEEGDRVIGLVSFWRDIDNPFDAPDNPNDYGFGYFLDPKARGRGITTEAVHRVMDVARANLHVENFIAYCERDNPDSIEVLTKLGFELTDIELTEQNSGWVEVKYVKPMS